MSDAIGRAEAFSARPSSASASKLLGSLKRKLGSSRMMFGTDHPFFPPLSDSETWKSVVENLEAIDGVDGWGDAEKDGVRGTNALKLFGLTA